MTKLNNLTTYINLEMTGDTRMYLVSAKQGDKATRYIVAKLLNNGEIYVIPEEAHAVINIRKPDGKHVYNMCEHNTEEIIVELTNQILAVAGTAYCDIEIRTEDDTQVITSASFTLEIEAAIRSDNAIKSSNEFTELENKYAEIKETEKKIEENEKERVEAENERKDNEESRILQEEKRQQDTEQSIEKAKTAAEAAENAANNCKKAIESAENFEAQAESYAKEAKSWAIGEGEVREDEAINNSKYFAEQAKRIVETSGSGSLIPMGTIEFGKLPVENVKKGWMYNISNDFTSDSRFEDGGNILYKAGANVYYTANGKWDVLAGIQVTGIKGDVEHEYRTGNVNITAENIGLGKVENVEINNQTPTFSQASTRANIASGEKLSIILGKIMKWYTDLKQVAFTGKYSDLSGRPTIPSVTNNLAATASGTALDAVQGKALNDKITQINSNLSELVGRFRYIPPFTAEKQTGIFNYILGFGLMLFIPYTFSYNEAILSNLRMFDEANTWNNVSGSFHGSVAAGGILFAIPTSSVEGMQFINHHSYGGQFSISIT